MTSLTKRVYDDLQKRFEQMEKDLGLPRLSLGDECVDRRNVLVDGMTEDHRQFWTLMFYAAANAANDRLLDMGIRTPEDYTRLVQEVQNA